MKKWEKSTILDLACKSGRSGLSCIMLPGCWKRQHSQAHEQFSSHPLLAINLTALLALSVYSRLPSPAPNPYLPPHLSLPSPSCIPKWQPLTLLSSSCNSHETIPWPWSPWKHCQCDFQISNCFSFDSLSCSVSIFVSHYVFFCLFALLRDSRLHGREGITGIREEEKQPIMTGWHEGHYRCIMANYNFFFTICVVAVDRISKCKQSAASLKTVFSECFSLSQKLLPHKAKSVNLAQQLSAQGSWPLHTIN